MAKTSAQPQDKYVLRLPDGMRDRLRVEADQNGRSMNAEIIHRLDSTLMQTSLFEWSSTQQAKADRASREAKMSDAEKEAELVSELLILEDQTHRVAKMLRKLRNLKPMTD